MVLSIIVPSYNSIKYIDDYENLFYLKELEGKVEFIFVNDGSTDDTLKKLEKVTENHLGYFRIVSKENGGHGSAINFGVAFAQGKYIKVIDADDYPDKSDFVNVISSLENEDSDLVLFDFVEKYISDNHEIRRSIFGEEIINENVSVLEKSENLCFHSVVFKKSLYLDHNIRLREKVFYEDQEFFLFPIKYINTVSYYPLRFYTYIKGDSGQSVSINSYRKHRVDHELVIYDLVSFYNKEIKEGNKGIFSVTKYFINAIINHYFNILIQNDDLKTMKSNFIEFDSYILSNKTLYILVEKNSRLIMVLRKLPFLILFRYARKKIIKMHLSGLK